MVYVRDLMVRNPNTVHPEMTLAQVMELMDAVACRHLPVLENGLLMGMVSDRDVRMAANLPMLTQEVEVAEFMTMSPITIEASATVQEAARLLNDKSIGALLVLEQGSLVGILTVYDILDYVARMPELAKAA